MLATLICTVSCAGNTNAGETVTASEEGNGTEKGSEGDFGEDKGAPTDADIYNAAAERLRSVTDLKQDIDIKAQKRVGSFEYSEQIERTALLSGAGTDALVCEINERVILDDSVINTKKTFKNGEATLEFKGEDIYYSSTMSAGEYTESIIPAVLFDSSLYSTVRFDESDKTVIRFEDATALEAWVSNGRARLVSAEGTAKLSSEGNIESMRYIAAYVQGPLHATIEITVGIGSSDLEVQSVGRTDTQNKKEISDIDAPYALRYATELIDMRPNCSGVSEEIMVSMAAGAAVSVNYSVASYGEGSDYIAKVEFSSSVENHKGESDNAEWVETYIDGKATISENKGDAAASSHTRSDFENYIYEVVTSSIIDISEYEVINVSTVGDYISIDFMLGEALGLAFEDEISYRMFGNEDAIDSIATGYNTKMLEGYVMLDMDTMMIVAVGIEYEGEHTIQGGKYSLSYTSSQILEIGDLSAYEKVKDEPLPDTEPENKATPVFYEVTSPNGKKMYLLGTIHVGDDKTAYLPGEIYSAFEDSDALAVEIDVSKTEEWIEEDEKLMQDYINSIMYTDGTTAYDKLPSELHSSFKKLVKIIGGVYYGDYYMPCVVASEYERDIVARLNSLLYEKGVDERLISLANKEGKEVLSVESLEDRFAMNGKYSNKTQELLLESALKTSRAEYEREMNEMYSLWCEGDEEKLREYLKAYEIPEDATEEEIAAHEEYERVMMTERDKKMLEKAKEYLNSDKTVFFAVGLAHVLGETGLVDSLRAEGYTVTRVEYK